MDTTATKVQVQKRSANWTEGERVFAVQFILDRYNVLQAKFRGVSQEGKEKEKVWQEITDQLNAEVNKYHYHARSGQVSCLRTAAEIKMFGNMKTRAKDKFDSNSKTGGGPQIKLSPTEELIICHMLSNNSSQLRGLDSGIDSLPSQTEKVIGEDVSNIIIQEVFEGNNLIDSNNNTFNCGDDEGMTVPLAGCSGDGKSICNVTEERRNNKTNRKSSKRIHDDKENDLYDLERKKILAEIHMIEQKTWQNNELFLLQKKILEKQLDS